MATFTAGTSFTDGVTGDVTAAKLNALVANATPLSNFITDRTAETSIATDDLVLISDTSDSGALNKMTVANLMKAEITGTINSTAGTITTLNSTTGTITTGVIPTLTSTTLITSGTGTASAPAIVPTGDTNTGIFFPAADTIAFSEGGTESMRIDSSGNVGIGTTSPSDILHVSKANGVSIFESTGVSSVGIRLRTNSTDRWQIGCPSASADLAIYTGAAATERLRIDSSGNVGIGDTTPEAKITVKSSTGPVLVAEATNLSQLVLGYNNTSVNYYDADTHIFRDSPDTGNERLRITSGGNVGIGKTNPTAKLSVSDGTVDFNVSPDSGTSRAVIGTETNHDLALSAAGGTKATIKTSGEVYIAGTTDQGAYNLQVNGTGVWGAGAYVNGSDERLKENIQDITSGLDVVEKLRPVSFQYKEEYTADRSIQSGFIAQDLLVALEGKNYLEGVVSQGPTYYNVAYQNLIPILAKAIQDLKAINDSQAQTITAIESRIAALEAA